MLVSRVTGMLVSRVTGMLVSRVTGMLVSIESPACLFPELAYL
jgi:hypothetical protein